jgi:hypothetical protein
MEMGYAPCSGYVVRITRDNLSQFKIPLTDLEFEYRELIDIPEDDFDLLCAIVQETTDDIELQSHLSDPPTTIWLFQAENGGPHDDLDNGGLYLYFNIEDLYIQKLTVFARALLSNGVLPNFQQWTEFT